VKNLRGGFRQGEMVLYQSGLSDLARAGDEAHLMLLGEKAFDFSGQITHFDKGRILS
jgi:hypothetical protein